MTTAQAMFLGPILGSLVGGLFGVLGSMVASRKVRKEMKPNGGSSMKDQLGYLTQQTAYLTQRFDEHIKYHLEGKQ